MSTDLRYQRIESLDLIRGFAILGILIMNIYSMALPPVAYWVPTWSGDAGAADMAVFWFQSLFVESRFMSMFTMLFGVGLALQADRARARDEDPRPRLRRRLAWLLAFGLVHGFLFWAGDVLALYAIIGLLVLPATRWSPKRLVTVGVALIAVGQVPLGLLTVGAIVTGENLMGVPPVPFDPAAMEAARSLWTTIPSRLVENGTEFGAQLLTMPFFLLWHSSGVMLLGMALYRRGFFSDARAWRRGLPFLVAGFALGGAVHAARFAVGLDSSAAQSLLGAMMIPGILMGIGYMSLLVPFGSATGVVARALRNTGKTAFTLYLGQTVVSLLIFVVILRGSWGTWTRGELALYVIALVPIQVAFAHWWQTTRGQGPLEALWRGLAAGRR